MKTLARSENYIVESEFETVFLTDLRNGRKTIIGDFYGDADGAMIDIKERFAIVFGCGVIIYYLREPFEEYRYNTVCEQWKEIFRDGDKWIISVEQIRDSEILITFEDGTQITART